MPWTIDSCVLLDIALADPAFAMPSAKLLDRLRRDGLVICPVSVVEVAPCFGGLAANVQDFAEQIGADAKWEWVPADTENAAAAWSRHVSFKRAGKGIRRPIADILIGAFALRTGGLVTRNVRHFSAIFPSLKIVDPSECVC